MSERALSSGFLDDAALRKLTGWKLKSRQIQWLRAEAIPFRVNGTGHPVVTWAAVEGRSAASQQAPQDPKRWSPKVAGA